MTVTVELDFIFKQLQRQHKHDCSVQLVSHYQKISVFSPHYFLYTSQSQKLEVGAPDEQKPEAILITDRSFESSSGEKSLFELLKREDVPLHIAVS